MKVLCIPSMQIKQTHTLQSAHKLTFWWWFLSKLLPGDCILVDWGFDIAKDVARTQATLHIPSFKSVLRPNGWICQNIKYWIRYDADLIIGATLHLSAQGCFDTLHRGATKQGCSVNTEYKTYYPLVEGGCHRCYVLVCIHHMSMY